MGRFKYNVPLLNHMVHNWNNTELEIIEQLAKAETHVRGMAKLLHQPHSTIFRKLLSLEKKNVVDFRIMGKNKIYFLKKNLSTKKILQMMEEYKYLKLIHKYPFLEPLFEEILRHSNDKMIILFGSYAKYLAQPESDIDLYVETTDLKIKKIISQLNSKLSVKIGKFDQNSLLIKEIIKNHVILRGIEDFYEKNKFLE